MSFNNQIVVCIGTDIPPIKNRYFWIYALITELIKNKNKNIFSMDELFEGHTYSRKERFALVSYLVKKRFIKREKVDASNHRYESIPKIYYREAKEMRFYEAINRKMDIEFCKKIPMID